jgi:hypothetical protein
MIMATHGRRQGGTTRLHLILAWDFGGLPLAWGIIETVLNALKLFQKV